MIKPEALGEDEKHRPQPIFEQSEPLSKDYWIESMHRSVERLATDRASRGDLKLLARTLRELRYALKVFQPYRRRRKVTIFGSARTPRSHPTYQMAYELAEGIAKHDWMVITGAGPGIMAAGHEGAGREASMGLNILLPFEQSANEFIDGDPKLVTLRYFFTRKLMFIKECSGVVCLPGGFGTLDEALEVLTLMQTGKQTLLPFVFLDEPGGNYWTKLFAFFEDQLLHGGLISSDDVHLFKITDSVQETIDTLMGFYRVYHSMRYVRDQLVLRLNRPLTTDAVAALNEEFATILVSGEITQCNALEAERNEPEIIELPRLCLNFNRRNFGRLRMLIDRINDSPASS